MPLVDRDKYNNYMNAYMKQRYEKRRKTAIAFLGGQCNKCGSIDDLEFDHIDPATKEMTVARASSLSDLRWNEEIAKCQLLCKICHRAKHYQ